MVIKTILLFALTGITMLVLIPLGLLALVLSPFGLKKPMAFLLYKAVQGWAWIMIRGLGSELSVSGREFIPAKGGLCFVCNHTGYFDIVIAFAVFGRPIGFIAKKELLFVPFLNMWIWLLGGFFIDRKNVKNARATINKGIDSLKSGGAVVIFPEGKRSKGKGLLPFHPGSFKLATQAGVPILPVSITGSYEVFEKTGWAQPVPIKVVVSPPVETATLSVENRKQILAEKVHGIIAESISSAG